MKWRRPWPQPDERSPEEFEQAEGISCYATPCLRDGELYVCCEVTLALTHPQPPALVSKDRGREILLHSARMEEFVNAIQPFVSRSVYDALKVRIQPGVYVGPGHVDPGHEADLFDEMREGYTLPNVSHIDGKAEFWISLTGDPQEYSAPEVATVFGLVLGRSESKVEFRIGISDRSMSYLIFHPCQEFAGERISQTRGVMKIRRQFEQRWEVSKMADLEAIVG